MPAVWLKLITVLCISCTALSGPGTSGVVWRDLGDAITIQCRPPEPGQEYLTLKKGLSEELEVLFKDGGSEKSNTDKIFRDRLQLQGVFPDMDILIKNLTSDDTGPYWCKYKKFDPKSSQTVSMRGTGSVLLVVTDRPQCDPSSNNLILVCVVVCAAVLLGVIIFFLIWIIRKNKTCTTKKPRHVANNDVYEDMRGTNRR